MPEHIKKKFRKKYGKKAGEKVYYATANKQGRDPETFEKKEESFGDIARNIKDFILGVNPGVQDNVIDLIVDGMLNPVGDPSIKNIEDAKKEIMAYNDFVDEENIKGDKTYEKIKIGPNSLQKLFNIASEKVKEFNEGLDSSKETISKNGSKSYRYDGLNKEYPEDMGIFNESYIGNKVKTTGIPKEKLESLWEECVLEETNVSKHSKGSRRFWKGVTNRFESRLDEIAVQEARTIMSERDALKARIEGFLNSMANEDYVGAKENLPKMLDSSWSILINSRKDSYLKELGKRVQNKAREA